MRIHPALASIVLGALVAIQGWTLHEVVSLKVQVAMLSERLPAKFHSHEKSDPSSLVSSADPSERL
jgi:hypothetical protein